MMNDKLGYVNVANTTTVIKPSPAGLFAVICTVAGNITIYDNASAASGTILFAKTGATAGDIYHFGGNGVSANNGIVAVTTGTINVLYT